MKGFKVFDPDWKCLDFQYEVGKTYKHKGKLIPCKSGFHFCKNLIDCFKYYDFNPENKVAEIEAVGNVLSDDDIKYVTDKIKIIRELSWFEVLALCNTGYHNTGKCNRGDYNTGDFNSGRFNSGRFNSGCQNTGNTNSGKQNTGNGNTGDCNSGDCNTGDYNTGDWNSGDYNTGDFNFGDRNSGHNNSGDLNSGCCNSGGWNTGDYNSGKFNVGDHNSGNRNSGYYNSGNRNSGYFNSIDYETGVFNNTPVKTIRAFNKEIPFDKMDEINTNEGFIQFKMNFKLNEWVEYYDMTDEEKKKYPYAENIRGYLKNYTYEDACKNSWNKMTDEEKQSLQQLPHFDPEVFKDITGIDINE